MSSAGQDIENPHMDTLLILCTGAINYDVSMTLRNNCDERDIREVPNTQHRTRDQIQEH